MILKKLRVKVLLISTHLNIRINMKCFFLRVSILFFFSYMVFKLLTCVNRYNSYYSLILINFSIYCFAKSFKITYLFHNDSDQKGDNWRVRLTFLWAWAAGLMICWTSRLSVLPLSVTTPAYNPCQLLLLNAPWKTSWQMQLYIRSGNFACPAT